MSVRIIDKSAQPGTTSRALAVQARTLAARGSAREALAVLDREFPYPYPIGSGAVWELERARLAERLRETEKARYLYGYLARVWHHADPELQPFIDEAREAEGFPRSASVDPTDSTRNLS